VLGCGILREVESVLLDIVGDRGAEQVGAGIALAEALAQAGSGDILLDPGEEVDAGTLGGGEMERGEALFSEGGEGVAGAGDDDPLGEFEQPLRLAPVMEIQEGVGAGEAEEGVAGVERAQGGEGVDGVVGKAAGAGAVEVGDHEAVLSEPGVWGFGLVGVAGVRTGRGDHRHAVGEAGGIGFELERLATGGGKEDLVEVEGVGGSPRDGHVAAVGRIEGAAEDRSSWCWVLRWCGVRH